MSASPEQRPAPRSRATFARQLRERGVLRVAASYAIIAWLTLQIADVTFEPFDVPNWVMIALIVVAVLGLPIALLLAWFLEITPQGIAPDTAPAGVARPNVHGVRRYADILIIQNSLSLGCGPSNGLLPAAVLTYRALGEHAAAEDLAKRYREQLMRALASAPSDSESLVMLSALDAVVGQKAEAVSSLRRALEAVPCQRLFMPTMLVPDA